MSFIKAIKSGQSFRFPDDPTWYGFISIRFTSVINGTPIVEYGYYDDDLDMQVVKEREGFHLEDLITTIK